MDPNIPVQTPTPEITQPVVPPYSAEALQGTATPPVQPAPVIPPAPKKVSGVLIAGLILLFVSVLALVGYYFIQTNGLKVNISTPTPIALTSPSPVATTDPTANWKTYIDPQNRFIFKYPQEEILDKSKTGAVGIYGPDFVIFEVMELDKNETDPIIWFRKPTNLFGYEIQCYTYKSTDIVQGSQKAIIIIKNSGLGDMCVGSDMGNFIIASYKGELFWLNYIEGHGMSDEILSTFKFLN